MFDAGKTPVFWAGFWPGGEEGIDTRQALADFISSVNGFQLADTEWGQAAESEGANNLEACTWDRKKNWWNAAAINMAQAMAFHNVTKITIALHKTLHGHFSFYKTILYQAELPSMGHKMRSKSTWNPEFEVRSIAVKGAPPDESGCALASEVKSQLKLYASRPVTVWCRPCTTLQSCGDKQEVEDESVKGKCIEGDCQNGQGTQTWADGDIYQGQWKNGKKDGQGTYTWKDRNKYQGQWKNGKKDGQGTYTFANGDKYAGDFKNNIFDGQGTLAWAHGEKYQGGWKNGLEHGQGTYTFTNGEKYQGGWKNGLKEGHGTYTLANGNKYQGEWKNDKKDGQGTLTEANGNKYQGQWKNDLKEGQGTYTFPDGENYQGGWKNDLQHGQGTMILGRWHLRRWLEERPAGRPGHLHLALRQRVQSLAQGGPFDKKGQEMAMVEVNIWSWGISTDPEKGWKGLKMTHAAEHLRLMEARKLHHFWCGCCGHVGSLSKMSG